MPLFFGKKNVGKNIKAEMKAGKPKKQAVAIGLRAAGASKKKKGGSFLDKIKGLAPKKKAPAK